MKWLARLKRENTPETHATKATKPPQGDSREGFVGFVASPSAPFQNFEAPVTIPANDSHRPLARLADPDRWCWPQSTAMNGSEIDTFTARLSRFTELGLGLSAGEAMADKLVIRDREGDDRRLCLECLHYGRSGRCAAAMKGGLAGASMRLEPIPTALQRCGAFALRGGLV